MSPRRIAAALLLAALAVPARAGKPFPPSPSTYVYNENVLTPAGEQRLSSYLADFEHRTGHQLVVAAFASLDGENVDDYTNRLFRAWKIGDAQRNDGILFALYQTDRKWRVEVGYGLEPVVTDLEAAEIARAYGVPEFRSGDFDGGAYAVAHALGDKIEGKAASVPRQPGAGSSDQAPAWVIWSLVIFLLLIRWLAFHSRGGWYYSGGGWGGDGGWGGGGGGFSGGGGSSGGGGASGGW